MKQKFSALDVRATVSDLRERILGLRLQNIYDVNAKTYLFKFSKPDRKELLLLESGIRIHTTQFARDKSTIPSNFCMKLRKHLRTRRLTDVRQVGIDRIIDFEFAGIGEGITYHIFTEFYASGNIILTDHEYMVLALLRVVQPKENERIAVGHTYDIGAVARSIEPILRTRLQDLLKNAKNGETLKKVLNSNLNYGQTLTEHAIRVAQLNPNLKVTSEFDTSDESIQLNALLTGFQEADHLIEESGRRTQKGYIILLRRFKNPIIHDNQEEEVVTYDEFHPYLFEQHKHKAYKEFDSFDMAVDEYFSSMESQKLEIKQQNQEEAALKKLETIKKEQYGRVQNLEHAQSENVRRALSIEANIEIVDQAIMVIRNAIASSIDWKDLENLVAEERKKHNPIALIIDKLKLDTNQISLSLRELDQETFYDSSDDEDKGEETKPKTPSNLSKIDVDIYLSAFANARKYYDAKKQSALKQEKTLAVADKAFKSAEQKIKQDLKETKITATINKIRKPFWFEKFMWFISSENYLVIAGRDMQQNELIVKRHLRKGDVYVHADLHGAASVIIKNSHEGEPIPPSTLFQAGVMSVCQSKAWEAKIITSAYWVNADQVSKTAPTGEYLTTGSFMIRGKKNFLPPVQLVYGYGLLFRLEEESIPNHLHERRPLKVEEATEENQNIRNSPWSENNVDSDSVDSVLAKPIVQSQQISSEIQETEPESPRSLFSEGHDILELDDEENNLFPDNQDSSSENSKFDKPTWDKYNLDEYGNDQEEEQEEDKDDKTADQKTKKKHLSAKERRTLKKQKEGNPSGAIDGNPEKQNSNKGKEALKQLVTPTRGKKGKLKKIKEKYADQDEEERQSRMELLSPAKGPQPKGKKAKKEMRNQILTKKIKQATKGDENDEVISTQPTQDDEFDEKLEVDENESEEVRQLLKEENVATLENDNLTVLDTLTGVPFPNDILLFAVPVCAPYSALNKYKFKVKITPGSMKKGKACKIATNFFLADSSLSPREKELIKSVPDTEMISVMLGKSKPISFPDYKMISVI
ncbi:hypothetical protein G9A89_009377 [Geosiphon pyriformis]|nr:hypothetical protein G9A89_009377 [Geosiphon pyriformis]